MLSDKHIAHKTCLGKIGIMGHSLGGLGALIAGSEDTRIKCIVGLAPAILPEVFTVPKEIYSISIPTQLQIGSNDGIIPPENIKGFFNKLNTKHRNYVHIEGGNHIRFLNKNLVSLIGEYLSRLGIMGIHLKDQRANITFEEQHVLSSKRFLEWFDNFLKH